MTQGSSTEDLSLGSDAGQPRAMSTFHTAEAQPLPHFWAGISTVEVQEIPSVDFRGPAMHD